MTNDPQPNPAHNEAGASPSPNAEATEIAWSTDGEVFNHSSLGDALDELDDKGELTVGRVVWFGETSRPDPTCYFDADNVLEMIGERAYDDAGELAEGYPDVSDDAKTELNTFLEGWLKAHCQPPFWRVDAVKEYCVTADDVAEREGQ